MFPGGQETLMVKPTHSSEVPEVEASRMDEIPQEVPNLDQHLQTLRDLLSLVTVPASVEVEGTTSMSVWTRRQLSTERKFKAAVPELLNCMLAAESLPQHCCHQCKTVNAVVSMSAADSSPNTNLLLWPRPKLYHHARKADCLGYYQWSI
ncbi:hypothetical protein JOB18_002166 [Solea senegalensis]|uniref:Uncharacterized protein n=1 Tax=Solea senegalensis TaxID=28829 RepID=A0AAV6RQM3_SOLSE|nr:hypothetical protein JOB18_002166 [Solea senegalensis]